MDYSLWKVFVFAGRLKIMLYSIKAEFSTTRKWLSMPEWICSMKQSISLYHSFDNNKLQGLLYRVESLTSRTVFSFILYFVCFVVVRMYIVRLAQVATCHPDFNCELAPLWRTILTKFLSFPSLFVAKRMNVWMWCTSFPTTPLTDWLLINPIGLNLINLIQLTRWYIYLIQVQVIERLQQSESTVQILNYHFLNDIHLSFLK